MWHYLPIPILSPLPYLDQIVALPYNPDIVLHQKPDERLRQSSRSQEISIDIRIAEFSIGIKIMT